MNEVVPFEEEYNGWANYTTWLVALWIDNDEPIYRKVHELIDPVLPKGDREVVAYRLRRWIGSRHVNEIPGLWEDFQSHNCKWQSINWHDLADKYLLDYQLEKQYEHLRQIMSALTPSDLWELEAI